MKSSYNHKNNPAGIPKGSSPGPNIFMVYNNDLSSMLEHSETNLLLMISEAGSKKNQLWPLSIIGIHVWLSANKLSANLIKTENIILANLSKTF